MIRFRVARAGARGETAIEILQSRIEIGDEKITADPQGTENEGNSLDRDPYMECRGLRFLYVQHRILSHTCTDWNFPLARHAYIVVPHSLHISS